MVKTVLVIECTPTLNWYEVFNGSRVIYGEDSEEVIVEQAQWSEVSMTVYHDSGPIVELNRSNKPLPGTSQENNRTIKPDFCLIRSVVHTIENRNSKNLLLGLKFGNVPTLNSLDSCLFAMERPWMMGELLKVQKKLGDAFPLIPITYYSRFRDMIISPEFPAVAKMGPFHAGYGKMLLRDRVGFDDFRSIVAVHGDYATAEKYVEWDYDVRIQKIGNHYRVFKRTVSVATQWKGNIGNAMIEEVELLPRYKLWADECAKLMGGLDIMALDLVHSAEEDKEYILELNDTAIGLVHTCEVEDMGYIRDMVLAKMADIGKDKGGIKGKSELGGEDIVGGLQAEIQRLGNENRTLQHEKEKLESDIEVLRSKKKWF